MGYQRVVITRPGGLDVLQVVEEPQIPQPGPGEALVRVLAAGVARADLLMRRGTYPGPVPPLPYSPGYDIAGQVEAVNDPASSLAAGQMVAAVTGSGGYSQYICLPVKDLVPIPEGLDPAEVVSLVLNYLTAYQMLHRFAGVLPGSVVLVHAATSGVGTALLQLGKLAYLKTVGTSSPGKAEIVKDLGARPIDYTHQDFLQVVRQDYPGGMDAIFDPIGGRHLWKSYRALSPAGSLIAYGELSTAAVDHPARIDLWLHHLLPVLLPKIPGRRNVRWYEMRPFNREHPEWYRQDLAHLASLLREGRIRPVIAARLPLAEARLAQEMLEGRQVSGKIVLICDE